MGPQPTGVGWSREEAEQVGDGHLIYRVQGRVGKSFTDGNNQSVFVYLRSLYTTATVHTCSRTILW